MVDLGIKKWVEPLHDCILHFQLSTIAEQAAKVAEIT